MAGGTIRGADIRWREVHRIGLFHGRRLASHTSGQRHADVYALAQLHAAGKDAVDVDLHVLSALQLAAHIEARRIGQAHALLHQSPGHALLVGALQFGQLYRAVHAGHLQRIEELRAEISKLPPEAQHKAGQELAARYKEFKFDLRLERLDRAVAENERRIRELTQQAETYVQQHEYRKLTDVLAAAGKLQKHNAGLLRTIERTEQRLLKAARDAGQSAPSGVSHD